MSVKRIGIDLAEVGRFRPFVNKPSDHFLERIFTKSELDYCFKQSTPAVHLAGTFAAKEACSKALGVRKYPFAELEIRRRADGAPELCFKGKRLNVAVSITHTKTTAAAIVAG